jgi:hypothetical protein
VQRSTQENTKQIHKYSQGIPRVGTVSQWQSGEIQLRDGIPAKPSFEDGEIANFSSSLTPTLFSEMDWRWHPVLQWDVDTCAPSCSSLCRCRWTPLHLPRAHP